VHSRYQRRVADAPIADVEPVAAAVGVCLQVSQVGSDLRVEPRHRREIEDHVQGPLELLANPEGQQWRVRPPDRPATQTMTVSVVGACRRTSSGSGSYDWAANDRVGAGAGVATSDRVTTIRLDGSWPKQAGGPVQACAPSHRRAERAKAR
jgi:hypothetical protein